MKTPSDENAQLYAQEFNQMTTLKNNEIKLPLESTEPINKPDDTYIPFNNRDVSHPNSSIGAVIHLVKSSLGTGILAMPYAFKNGGLIFGTIGTLVVGFLVTHCVNILVKSSHEICRRSRTPSLGFSETAKTAFEYGPQSIKQWAPFASVFVDVCVVTTYYFGLSVYVVFIADSIQQLIHHYLKTNWPLTYYMLLLLIPLVLICQVRELKYLVPFSFSANVCLVVTFTITLYYVFVDLPEAGDLQMMGSFSQLPLFFSTVIFAIEGIGVVMPVENNMKHPHHFLGCPGVLNIAMFIITSIFTLIGFCGYLKYEKDTQPAITINLPVNEILAQVAKICVVLAVFFTYALLFYVPYDIAWRKWISPNIPPRYSNLGQVCARTVLVSGSVAIAIMVPGLDLIITLVGALCFSTLGILIPVAVDTIVMWDSPGVFNWRLIKNGFLFAFYLFALSTGTYTVICDTKGRYDCKRVIIFQTTTK
ncbi:proton-coupled amino acid transporter-like protein CG1139 isoform X2 [Agrilus planipennis]|nr:proton-coupled amino acid transporter-like protein CG1139 isoform X2 [Agrilus planipennis]XP_018329906.1 proton-coupled amino acid transporter-like protein CG1139 isoform X2 [Agrilus planipennis]XP_018329907.1 proton-coupled amino acid transporter-like protein CG1139 isoform X2 [Agrilus planipennis]